MAATKGHDRLHGFLSLLGKAADYVSHTSHKAPLSEPLTLRALALVPIEPGAPISPPDKPLEAPQFDVDVESAPSEEEVAEPAPVQQSPVVKVEVPVPPRPSPTQDAPKIEAVSTQVPEKQVPAATQCHIPLSPLPASFLPSLVSPVLQPLQLVNVPSIDTLPLPSTASSSTQHTLAAGHQRPPTPDSPLSRMSDADDDEADRSPKRRRTAVTIEPFRVWRTLVSDFEKRSSSEFDHEYARKWSAMNPIERSNWTFFGIQFAAVWEMMQEESGTHNILTALQKHFLEFDFRPFKQSPQFDNTVTTLRQYLTSRLPSKSQNIKSSSTMIRRPAHIKVTASFSVPGPTSVNEVFSDLCEKWPPLQDENDMFFESLNRLLNAHSVTLHGRLLFKNQLIASCGCHSDTECQCAGSLKRF